MKLALLLSIFLTTVCTPNEAALRSTGEPATQNAASVGQRQNFINVEGPDLQARLAAAVKQGQGKRFWAAYTFAVRPGVAFDAVFTGSRGSTFTIHGITNNPQLETRNLGIFLLHEGDGRAVVRTEIYNLDRARDYAGYPVYWLGRAASEESLQMLRSLVGTLRSHESAERLVDAIGAHDDPRVATHLRELIGNSTFERVRKTAISWLGHWPEQTEFLSTLVRNERESVAVRREAAEAIAESPDSNVLATLQTLYRTVTHREVKRELLEATADERFETTAVGFLVEVTERDPDRELRRTALEGLGEKRDARSLQALEKAAHNNDAGVELQRAAVEAIGERPEDEALPLLKKIVQTHPRSEVRREAVERLGQLPGQTAFLVELVRNQSVNLDVRRAAIEALTESEQGNAFDTLKQLYGTVNQRELKEEILEALAEGADRPAAIEFLLGIARNDADRETREKAFSALGEMKDERAVDALIQLYDAGRDEEAKNDILGALAEADHPRAMQKLIAVAQRDAALKLRKRAIELLGESDDPTAIKFLEQLIK
jgi:HEAT repeat protein